MSNKWFIDSSTDAAEARAFYQNNTRGITEKLAKALDPYGFMDFQSITGISGPGNYICVYLTLGDIWTACINHDFEILWNHSCGGTNVKEEKQRGYILETKETPETLED